jgi:predicted nuclease of predicted toxin-antitoxin system
MWLLDVNMPMGVAGLLGEFGIEAYHAGSRGWGALTNGVLVETASAQGFICVLTRDRLFGESAARALKTFREFSVVLVTIRQVRGPEFLRLFRSAWERNPLRPIPGQLLNWP